MQELTYTGSILSLFPMQRVNSTCMMCMFNIDQREKGDNFTESPTKVFKQCLKLKVVLFFPIKQIGSTSIALERAALFGKKRPGMVEKHPRKKARGPYGATQQTMMKFFCLASTSTVCTIPLSEQYN